MGVSGAIGGEVARRLGPGVAGPTVRALLERAIEGVPGIPGAAAAADVRLRKTDGDVQRAIDGLISQHVRLAAAEGFLTNIGGLVTVAVTLPANIAGIALVQCHLAAAILHLRGYDLQTPGVRDAVLVLLLDADARKALSRRLGTPVDAAAVARGAQPPGQRAAVATAVTAELIAAAGGKRLAAFVARRVPLLGGAVGGAGDAWATRRIGRQAAAVPPRAIGILRKA
jgi:hypothetical protein